MIIRTIWDVVKETFTKWIDDKSPRLAASLAYYTVFAMAPTLVIVIAVASMVFGQDAAQGKIVEEMQGLVGHDAAAAVEITLKNTAQEQAGIVATIVGLVVLLLGATSVFIELQESLNSIWGVAPKPGRGILGLVRDRFLSFAMVIGTGFVLMVSLLVSAAVAALGDLLERSVPGVSVVLLQIIQNVISIGIFTVLIGAIYKVLPDAIIAWRDVAVGAVITAVLFTVGKFLIGLYLGQGSVASTYGAAGSLAVLLVWVYYSALIFFLGAEFTEVYANRWGRNVKPSANAILLSTREAVKPDGGRPVEDLDAIAAARAKRISQ